MGGICSDLYWRLVIVFALYEMNEVSEVQFYFRHHLVGSHDIIFFNLQITLDRIRAWDLRISYPAR